MKALAANTEALGRFTKALVALWPAQPSIKDMPRPPPHPCICLCCIKAGPSVVCDLEHEYDTCEYCSKQHAICDKV